jgi:subtilisin-like proprotein convertase family protein
MSRTQCIHKEADMKRPRGLVLGALLVIVLCIGTWRSVLAMEQRSDQADSPNPIFVPDTFAPPNPCSAIFHEQEIPDDGNWLQVCLTDPNAPDQSTITEVYVKYLLDHPDPNQLEIRLTRAGTSINQTLWNRGDAIKGAKLGEAAALDAFNGTPSRGEWHLLVRDVVPGLQGRLEAVTVRAYYAPVGPLPKMLSGSPGRPTSFRLPSGAKSNTLDVDSKKRAEPSAAPLQVSGWQDVKSETFEGNFPNPGWTVTDTNHSDNKEYLWDDDDKDGRAHTGGWAAWPANGGIDGLDPVIFTYPPNASSWMIYGPFDLSDAKSAETVFWLWRDIEVNFDYIAFGIARDDPLAGGALNGWQWDGVAGWEEERFSLYEYLGDSSVWVVWLFVSDGSVQYEGPWVDDVLIRKYVPGQLTVQGTFFYADRNNNTVPARFTKVSLYDYDPGGTDDHLGTVDTDANGYFLLRWITNWDDDGAEPYPDDRRLDLYVVWETDANDSPSARRRVTNFSGWGYQWASERRTNVPDGNADFFNYSVGVINQEAMWIFQDLRRAWEYVWNNTNPHTDPGSATARWEKDKNDLPPCSGDSCFYAGPGGSYVFIAHRNTPSADGVVHEVGHHYMYNWTLDKIRFQAHFSNLDHFLPCIWW